MVTPRYLKKKGDESGRVFIYTEGLKIKVDAGELIEISEKEAKEAISRKGNPPIASGGNPRYVRKSGAIEGDPYWVYTPAMQEKLVKGELVDYVPPTLKEGVMSDKDKALKVTGIPDIPNIPEVPDAAREQLIIAMIGNLNPESDDFTKGSPQVPSKPRVEVLEEKLGFDITSAERDAAWKVFQEGNES